MKLTESKLKQLIVETLQQEKSIEDDVMKIFKDGIDPQAAAEKLATMYTFRDFEKFRDATQWKDVSHLLIDWNEEVLKHMMQIA